MLTPTKAGIRYFQHTQSVAADVWYIYHGFGAEPMVDVNVLDNGIVKKAFPLTVEHTDVNNVTITWSAPRTGYVSFASTLS